MQKKHCDKLFLIKPVSVNLVDSSVCTLPSYPGVDGFGPVVMAYLADQQVLAACGSYARDTQACYQLSSGASTSIIGGVWEKMADQLNRHCPYPSSTKSFYQADLGWFVIGEDKSCAGLFHSLNSPISTELYTLQQEWIKTPTTSPYASGYPVSACSVAIDSTTIIVTGGLLAEDTLSSTWKLELTDFTWTQLEDIPTPRYGHACSSSPDGKEIIVAGGRNSSNYESSATFIYNMEENTWRQTEGLPEGWRYYDWPVMFLWNDHPTLVEYDSQNIWIQNPNDLSWELMEATMGANFNGYTDLVGLVPSGMFKCT